MPYLNWKNAEPARLRQEVIPHPERGSQLNLELGRVEVDELVSRLEEIFRMGGGELRLDLPMDWVVFWKQRETESRLLIAHPQEREWVTTVALDPPHGVRLLERMKALRTGESVALGELAPIGNVSNVEVTIKII